MAPHRSLRSHLSRKPARGWLAALAAEGSRWSPSAVEGSRWSPSAVEGSRWSPSAVEGSSWSPTAVGGSIGPRALPASRRLGGPRRKRVRRCLAALAGVVLAGGGVVAGGRGAVLDEADVADGFAEADLQLVEADAGKEAGGGLDDA